MTSVSGFNIAAVLFDLDSTLVNRDAAVRKLGLTFAESILPGNPTLSRNMLSIGSCGLTRVDLCLASVRICWRS